MSVTRRSQMQITAHYVDVNRMPGWPSYQTSDDIAGQIYSTVRLDMVRGSQSFCDWGWDMDFNPA